MDFKLAFEFIKSKGCRILPKEGNSLIEINKDKNGYNLVIIPNDPDYSIVLIGFDKNRAVVLRDKLNELLSKKDM